jgi:hypothetical protein
LVTAAVIIIALWVSFERPGPGQVSGVVATVDLRVISPTRGTENPKGAGPVKVRGDAAQLRIILPPGSEGRYDGEIIRREGDVPLLQSSGTTKWEDHDVVLDLPVSLRGLSPGRYSIVLRREGSEWEYYALSVE